MKREISEYVKIGDIVSITHAGKNYGKRGIVKSLKVDGRTGIFIEPLGCKIEFTSKHEERRHTAKDGLYIWPYWNLRIDNKICGGAVYTDSYMKVLWGNRQNIKEELNNKYGKETEQKPPLEPSNKIFYVGLMFGEDGICWPTDSFNDKELEVIERFLKEFNEHVSGKMIDCALVLDNDE